MEKGLQKELENMSLKELIRIEPSKDSDEYQDWRHYILVSLGLDELEEKLMILNAGVSKLLDHYHQDGKILF